MVIQSFFYVLLSIKVITFLIIATAIVKLFINPIKFQKLTLSPNFKSLFLKITKKVKKNWRKKFRVWGEQYYFR